MAAPPLLYPRLKVAEPRNRASRSCAFSFLLLHKRCLKLSKHFPPEQGGDGRNSQDLLRRQHDQAAEGSSEIRDEEKKLGDSDAGRETQQLDVEVRGPHGAGGLGTLVPWVSWSLWATGNCTSPLGLGVPGVQGVFLLWV